MQLEVSVCMIVPATAVNWLCWLQNSSSVNIQGGPKNVSTCFCQNFVISPPNLIG